MNFESSFTVSRQITADLARIERRRGFAADRHFGSLRLMRHRVAPDPHARPGNRGEAVSEMVSPD